MAGRLGIMLDDISSKKLEEISEIVEMDPQAVVMQAIATMYEAVKNDQL